MLQFYVDSIQAVPAAAAAAAAIQAAVEARHQHNKRLWM
jgi:hypothetical protein